MSTDTTLTVVDGGKKELPDELKAQLSRSYLKGEAPPDAVTQNLIELIKEPVNIDAIIVAYWEKHTIVLKRASTSTKLNGMAKKELIATTTKGTYQSVNKTKSSLPAEKS